MQKIKIIFFILILSCAVSAEESPISIKLKGGYSSELGNSTIDHLYRQVLINGLYYLKDEIVNINAGAGYVFIVGLNYQINSIFSSSLESGYVFNESDINVELIRSEYKYSVKYIPILLNLSSQYSINRFSPYFGAGIGFYFYSLNEKVYGYGSKWEGNEDEFEYESNIPFGIHIKLGSEFNLSSEVKIFGEIICSNYSLKLNKKKLVSSNYQTDLDLFNPGNQNYLNMDKTINANNLGFFIGLLYTL